MPKPLDSSALPVIGWDIGGAHVKACRLARGHVDDVAQWACPLWQGLPHLQGVLDDARARWPDLIDIDHAITMTGEMVDLFADRREGVQRIAETLAASLGGRLHFFAGPSAWCDLANAAAQWEHIASANWLATAQHVARLLNAEAGGVLMDIGSTTTDFIAFRAGRVLTTARTDVQRLASGELVYHGAVRTPLCAFTRRIGFRGTALNVMNEFFATAADVYRLTEELNPAHDLYPAADNGAKSADGTRARLARMIGMDARDASAEEWLDFARQWRAAQVAELGGQLRRVLELHGLGAEATPVAAGCGDFLAREVWAEALSLPREAASAPTMRCYGAHIARIAPQAADEVASWAQVCAPSVAVAALWEIEREKERR